MSWPLEMAAHIHFWDNYTPAIQVTQTCYLLELIPASTSITSPFSFPLYLLLTFLTLRILGVHILVIWDIGLSAGTLTPTWAAEYSHEQESAHPNKRITICYMKWFDILRHMREWQTVDHCNASWEWWGRCPQVLQREYLGHWGWKLGLGFLF